MRRAVAARDVNQLAESYHWVGQSSDQARGLMQRLETLAAAPLLDAQVFVAQIFGAGEPPHSDAGEQTGIMQLQLGGQTYPQVVDLNVVRYAGCYFARF